MIEFVAVLSLLVDLLVLALVIVPLVMYPRPPTTALGKLAELKIGEPIRRFCRRCRRVHALREKRRGKRRRRRLRRGQAKRIAALAPPGRGQPLSADEKHAAPPLELRERPAEEPSHVG